ncbi:hypothetical protein [Flavobacterium cellulosilyticum]|nr:hypothetical protein [Flavobacterium cellulosilyticum]
MMTPIKGIKGQCQQNKIEIKLQMTCFQQQYQELSNPQNPYLIG